MINSVAQFRAFVRVASVVEQSWTGDRYRAPVFSSVTEVYLRGAGGRVVSRACLAYSDARDLALDHVSDTADGCAWLLLYRFNSHPKCFWFEPLEASLFLSSGEHSPASVELFNRWLFWREVPSAWSAARSVDPLAVDGDALPDSGLPDEFAAWCKAAIVRSLRADAERTARGEVFVPAWAAPGAARWDED